MTYPRGLPRHSRLAGFGLSMTKLTRLEEFGVFRRFLPMIGLAPALVLGLLPALARAQVNIDQGKPPSEIFESDCATCHKSARGLADGKNSLMLSSFLREHYTASREQAAALAAYVLGAGGSAPAAQKPGTEHAKVEEPKESKPGEPKAGGHPEDHPATASRGHKQEPESAAPAPVMTAPAPVVATPAVNENPSSAEAPSQSSSPSPSASPSPSPGPSSAQSQGQEGAPTKSAAAPTEPAPSDNAPVPRDHIPD
jgi:hypothetical protein